MHTVPLRPDGGGGQRVNLIEIPSGVFRTPTTAPAGTGLAGMETSFIGEHFRKFARWWRVVLAPSNVIARFPDLVRGLSLAIHPHAHKMDSQINPSTRRVHLVGQPFSGDNARTHPHRLS